MTSSSMMPTILLGLATGARSAAGVAATARYLAARSVGQAAEEPARFLASPRVAATVTAFAAMEVVADKLPFIPNRTDAAPLVGRIVAGAVLGAAIAAVSNRGRAQGALVGSVAAFAGAHLGFQLRRELAALLPAPVAALAEDAAVGALVAAGVSAMSDLEPRADRLIRSDGDGARTS
jgi:uncharacterized membrane protein